MKGNVIIREKGTHQAHVIMGCKAYDFGHPRRIALYLLNNLLGGPGMNSLLNLSLRERNGLVYTVDSSMVSYSDTGLLPAGAPPAGPSDGEAAQSVAVGNGQAAD